MTKSRLGNSGDNFSFRDRLKIAASKLVYLRSQGVKETDSRIVAAKMEYDLARRELLKQTKPVIPTIVSSQVIKTPQLGEFDKNFITGAAVGVAAAVAAIYCWFNKKK